MGTIGKITDNVRNLTHGWEECVVDEVREWL